MKKLVSTFIITLLIITLLGSVTCLATQDVEKINDKIEKEIANAQKKAEKSDDDEKIAQKLVEKTEKIVDKIDAEGEYVEVQIGDVTVCVDPVHVVAD